MSVGIAVFVGAVVEVGAIVLIGIVVGKTCVIPPIVSKVTITKLVALGGTDVSVGTTNCVMKVKSGLGLSVGVGSSGELARNQNPRR